MNGIREQLEKNKQIVIIICVFVVGFFAYTNFFAGDSNDSFVSGEDRTVVNSEIGREIVTTLNQLKALAIDPDFFAEEDSLFNSLEDFSTDLEPQPVGKQNPFVNDLEEEEEETTEDAEFQVAPNQ